ncbi:hypothetical protein WOLCODRAFT_118223 [Wolfiporia cocos MD-104 SS10]|uniref:Uncharacterized protein n=1 Tax=Wolfiporia cocos (strain MD-104) TaxID=742152 RepID=A0A2H3JMI6_WOLCO|nr:hypothetical protein WOLCODRAFT_118223 [Wolfiporia cocos MD-104 SS10]
MLTASLARSSIVRHASCARKSWLITASKPQRRAFSSSVIQTLSDGFLDLAIALPLPQSLPPYSTTIILLTVATRLVFTLPFSVWAKNRQWKAENLVIPQIKQEMPRFHKQAIQDMKRDSFRGDKDAASIEVNKRVKALAKVRQKELLALHHASPLPTMAIPPATQLPIFVVSTMVLANTSQPPSVLDSESFLTITSLTHSDPTATLPIALGLVTLVNVETSRWFVSAAATAREKQVAQWVAERRAKGEAVVEPRKVMQTSLRILSVARILVAVAVPGNIQIYWVASATFGLIQTWALDWWHARRTEKYWQTHIPPLKSRVP